MAAVLGLTTACAGGGEARRVVPGYDPFTGRLVQLAADQDGDGRIDQWSYLEGQRPIRGEADTDGDGRIDRWEYFDATAALSYVGSSTRNDGIEDTWMQAAAVDGERQITRSSKRDRQVDRREYFRDDTMVRVEEDTNADGKIDKWDRYEGSVLREVRFDTSLKAGRPDRRLLYDAKGQFEAFETDPERDGAFVRLPGAEPVSKPGDVR